MASSPFFKRSNQVSCSVYDKIHGRSKAQMCLKRILDIISSQPRETSRESSLNCQFDGLAPVECASGEKARALLSGKRGLDIDLNLRLGPPLEDEESDNLTENRGFSACSAVGEANGKVCRIIVDCNSSAVSGEVSTVEKSSEGECDPKEAGNSSGAFPTSEVNIDEEQQQREAVEEETREFSEITNLQVRSSEIDDLRVCEETEDVEQSEIKAPEGKDKGEEDDDDLDEDGEERRLLRRRDYKSEGYLGLLIEAARLISGNFEHNEPEPEKTSGNDRLRHEAAEEAQKRTEAETEANESIRCGSKRNQCWMLDLYGEFEDISPVVRSKRGRNQVLPYRYRDSVLEPLKRLSRQRSTRVSATPRPR